MLQPPFCWKRVTEGFVQGPVQGSVQDPSLEFSFQGHVPVSYTHLTLPTNREV